MKYQNGLVFVGQLLRNTQIIINYPQKKHVKWILELLSTYSLVEIDNHFYEHVPQDELATSKSDVAHPYDVNWILYDSPQLNQKELKSLAFIKQK